ncbi:MAG: 30S ribosomal protein S18 [Candidatus Sungbacteria bacterium]|nr:30S ribosomal protein S18 [Candidatus Sungbacteria bacterium]
MPERVIKKSQKPTQCSFCTANIRALDYKDGTLLRTYLNPQGKILPRRRTGVCTKHQRLLAEAIKRARYLALIPYTLR